MTIEGFTNIYREGAGKYSFDFSAFVYASSYLAKQKADQNGDFHDGSKLIATGFPVKIEIPDLSGFPKQETTEKEDVPTPSNGSIEALP